MRYRLAANQTSLLEQPWIVVVELLIAVVRHHRCIHLVGDHQYETISSAQRTRRRRHQFAVGNRLGKLDGFLLVDTVSKTRIHHHRDLGLWVFLHERKHRFVQLLQARRTATFGGKVASIHHHMAGIGTISDFRFADYHVANVESIKSASSWSCTAFEPVAGLPDSTRAAWRRS